MINIVVAGAGGRANVYARYCRENPDRARIIAVAEPLAERRDAFAELYNISPENRFADWREMFDRGKIGDAALIATTDMLHTEPTLTALARQGIDHVDVMCPGFTSDCLETLEEIALEARAAFLGAGGHAFHYIPCLNDQHEWITALVDLALRHLQGWDTLTPPDTRQLETQRQRAQSMGARI